MTTNSDTSAKIIDAAEELIQQRGYNAFSYKHIAVRLGIKNAAIHYHFPSKESLGCAVVSRARQRFWNNVRQLETEKADVWRKLDFLFDIYEQNLKLGRRVCLIGSLGTDFFAIPEDLQTHIQRLAREIHVWLTNELKSGKNGGELVFESAADNAATLILSCLAGSLQIARIAGEDHFYMAVEQIRSRLQP